MNVEELQTALDRLEAWGGARDGLTVQVVFDLGVAVEAARLVANPNWWIEREHGERVAGPFTTDLDANRAREWIEKVTDPETFWIRQHAAALTPGDTE